jgi:hypothetical protein
MNSVRCPCDTLVFPPPLTIPAGLSSLPRQIATFPEFRAALLSALDGEAALTGWRARSSDDFGVMLLEMWAYVCDTISFYDEVIADECYVRTAQLRPSLRKLVALLGYVPRPAVGATVDLAVIAQGRQYVTLPKGIAFRSGAFPGSAPQVFELDADSRVHPFTNRWTLERTRPATLEPGPGYASSRSTFLVDLRSVAVKRDQLLLVQDLSTPANTRMRTVTSVDSVAAADGATYKQISVANSVPIDGSTLLTNLRLTTPGRKATIWQQSITFWPWNWWNVFGGGGTVFLSASSLSVGPIFGGDFPTGLFDIWNSTYVVFDALQRQIQLHDVLVLEKSGDFRWFTVADMGEMSASLPAPGDTTITDSGGNKTTVSSPAPQVQVTWVVLDAEMNDPTRREAGSADWQSSDAAYIKVHFGFRRAATPTVAANTTLAPGDPMILTPPTPAPQDGKAPGLFLLQDLDTNAVEVSANIDFAGGTLTPVDPLKQPLVALVTAYGNVVRASRGETVQNEILGSGDASLANQTFKLKKRPLTYFSAPDSAISTLRVYVDGLEWSEVPSFFGAGPGDQIYIVRQNDDGDSFATFGDGIRGCRTTTGVNNILAFYRFGAGKASPPAGSVHQLARPVNGIASVQNPLAASGGDDAEPADSLGTYAPRSALLLGRAISIPDMEAAAASIGDVRAVRAEWRWNTLQQCALVQVWYIGAATVAKAVKQKLRGLSDSVTPIAVDQATPIPATLSLSIEIDPRRIETDVLAAVRTALMGPGIGLLTPERIGIGLPLFRSRIFEVVLAVPGAVAVTGASWNDAPLHRWGLSPSAGNYFDLENGALLLNGKADSNG